MSIAEFEARLGKTLTGADRIRAEAAIEDTSRLIYSVVVMPSPVPDAVLVLALKVARRAYDNPDGYASETIGDYSYRRSTDEAAANENWVYLTDAECRKLRRAVGVMPVRSTELVTYPRPAPTVETL